MAVAGVGRDVVTKGPKLLAVTNGRLEEIVDDFRGMKELIGFFTINVSDIIRRLRARARAAGIDLERPFFFSPDDARFDQILIQVKRERDARIARLRRDKSKLVAVKARSRRHDISEVSRVKNLKYPVEMQKVA